MMSKTKIFSLILLICLVFVLGGCANIEYQRLVDDGGQILDKITIELDGEKLTEKGVDIDTLVDNIKEDLYRYYIFPIEYRLQSLPIEEYYEVSKKIDIGTIMSSVENDVYKISVEVLFGSSEVMSYVYGYDSSNESTESSGLEKSKNFFIKRYEQTSDNVFGDVTEITIGGTNLYDKYCAKVPGFDSDDLTLTQIYGSTNHRMRTNADATIEYNGFTCHLWEFSASDSEGKLVFYYLTANSTGWYVLALVLTILITAVIILVHRSRKRFEKTLYKTRIVLDENAPDFDGED